VSWTHTRSKIAIAKKKNPRADVTELRRQLKAERLAEYITRTVDAMPPLTNEQRDRLALLLRPGGDAA
jgi:type II secretory pathway predicted ATPase ExeA